MLLLDTCTLLWLTADQSGLSDSAKSILKENPGRLFISSISAFEIAVKHRSGKLRLPMNPPDWFHEALHVHGIHEVPVTADIAAVSALLEPHHNDPCDRMIIATAIKHAMPIITCDKLIGKYSEVKVLW